MCQYGERKEKEGPQSRDRNRSPVTAEMRSCYGGQRLSRVDLSEGSSAVLVRRRSTQRGAGEERRVEGGWIREQTE